MRNTARSKWDAGCVIWSDAANASSGGRMVRGAERCILGELGSLCGDMAAKRLGVLLPVIDLLVAVCRTDTNRFSLNR